ncbi:MAG: S-layer homology domain-containing protein [bacterium]|nr:S-layer homology domain-containing protein [bacterium]
MKKKKLISYSILSLLLTFSVGLFFRPEVKYDFLETSFLSILQRMTEDHKPDPPDLSIENVTLEKTSDPSDSFNFYKYQATVIIKNYGGSFRNAQVSMNGGENQKQIFVKNSANGLSLEEGQIFIFEKYDVIFDANYNGGNIDLEVKMLDRRDYFEGNNHYSASVFELPPQLLSIGVEEILDDGTFVIHYQPQNYILDDDNYEIITTDAATFDDGELKYDEVYSLGKIYSYYRIKNSLAVLEDDKWQASSSAPLESHFLNFDINPFEDEISHYAYIKAINPETGNFAISNIVKLPPQKLLTRAAFAKLFIDYTDEEIFDDGELFYEDIGLDAWYGPYVQTIYNLGLISSTSAKFRPDDEISRGDALRVVLDYYDIDLRVKSDSPHFEDIAEDHQLYPYVEALHNDSIATAFENFFNSEQVATKSYLKYLINEYKGNT